MGTAAAISTVSSMLRAPAAQIVAFMSDPKPLLHCNHISTAETFLRKRRSVPRAQRPLKGIPQRSLASTPFWAVCGFAGGAGLTNLTINDGYDVAICAHDGGRNGPSHRNKTDRPCLPLSVG